ncbi:hypothetical protein J3E72DRAFT_178365 [Bipolaris maydis]|nr:hypothetical protein J3E72DRAFT_178365 [Bipolaris maydis]
MAKTKTIVISQPMDARHVGGVNIMGSGSSSLDNYFNHNEAEPNERSPSGPDGVKLETRGRSDTVPVNTRRPGLSWKDSFSRLRQKSFSPNSRSRRGSEESPTPLRTRRSTTRLGQSIGLESDSDNSTPVSKSRTFQPELASARPTTASSIYSTATKLEPYNAITTSERKVTWNEQYLPPPGERKLSEASIRPAQPWAKPKRTDSGTAIDFTHVPVEERPIPFQEIMAVPSLSERLAMYKKTRDYWATADHGLGEWVERAASSKIIAA